MPFVPNDPPEFLHYQRMKEVLCHHEAGHLFLAFYYGYQIGMFRLWDNKKDVWGAIKNRRTDAPPAKETLENLNNEVRKLLAGELAAHPPETPKGRVRPSALRTEKQHGDERHPVRGPEVH